MDGIFVIPACHELVVNTEPVEVSNGESGNPRVTITTWLLGATVKLCLAVIDK